MNISEALTQAFNAQIRPQLVERMAIACDEVADAVVAEAKRRAPVRKLTNRKGGRPHGPRTKMEKAIYAELSEKSLAAYKEYYGTEEGWKAPRFARRRGVRTTTSEDSTRRQVIKYSNTAKKQAQLKFANKPVGIGEHAKARRKKAIANETRRIQARRARERKMYPGGMKSGGYGSRARYEVRKGIGFAEEMAGELETGGARMTTRGGGVRYTYGGRLRDSIHKEATEVSQDGVRITIVADAPYAKYVEYGTRHMAAQPFLLPAVKHWQGSRFNSALQKAIQEG